MQNNWELLFFLTGIPALLMAIGSILAFIKPPTERVTSIVQHFAAGVVFSAVAVELLPKIINQSKWAMSIGFICGVIFMLLIDQLGHHLSESQNTKMRLPFGQMVAVAIDVFIDGILIGVSFLASERSGLIVAAALALEVFFLGISTAVAFSKKRTNQSLSIMILIITALLIPCGAFLGYGIVSNMSLSAHMLILAFGVAALLFLVTEELLVEAHETKETTIATSAFFAGFLLIMLF